MGFSANNDPDFNYRSQSHHSLQGTHQTGNVQETSKSNLIHSKSGHGFPDKIVASQVGLNLSATTPQEEIPQLPHPLSQKSLTESIESVIQSGSHYLSQPIKKKKNEGIKDDAAATTPPPSSTSSSSSSQTGGIAAFLSVQAQLSNAEAEQLSAAEEWVSELNQLSYASVETLGKEAENITNMENELSSDQAQIAQLEEEIPVLESTLDDMTAQIDAWMSSNFNWDQGWFGSTWDKIFHNSSFMVQLQEQFPTVYSSLQYAVDNGENVMAVLISALNSTPGLTEFFESYMTSSQIDEWQQVSSNYLTYATELSADQSELTTLQNQVNELSGPDGEIAQATAQFTESLKKDGITNLTPSSVQGLIAILNAMAQIETALMHIQSVGGSAAVAIFTYTKNAITAANQDTQTASAQDVSAMDEYNLDLTDSLVVLSNEVTAQLADISNKETTLSNLQIAIDTVGATLAVLTASALIVSCIPIIGETLGPILWFGVAALSVVMAGLEIAKGSIEIEVGKEQKQVAQEQKEMTDTSANAQYSSNMANTLTQGLVSLSKNLQQMVQDANQVYANLSASVPPSA